MHVAEYKKCSGRTPCRRSGRVAGETKTGAIRRALLDRKARLAETEPTPEHVDGFQVFLEREVWPIVPADQIGRRLTRSEEDEILGYEEHGA